MLVYVFKCLLLVLLFFILEKKFRHAYFEQKQNEEQRVIQRQRVLRQFEKYLQGKRLCEVDPENVVRFLIFKEIEGKGRTIVH